VNVLALVMETLAARATLPQAAEALDRERARAPVRVHIDAATARRVLAPGTLVLANRALATRLYDCSAARSLVWWLGSLPVRVLACRGWRVARRGRVPGPRPSVAAPGPAGQGRSDSSLP
jgi:hypothetical protein